MNTELAKTLEAVARFMNAGGHEWVVFGGAAMVMHGYETGAVSDVDILVSAETAVWMMKELTLDNHADGRSTRFRSDYFLHPDFGSIPVEVVANFRILSDGEWHPVSPTNATRMRVRGQTVFAMEQVELAKVFDLCGREKDLVRSKMLRPF